MNWNGSRGSGLPVNHRLDDPQGIAAPYLLAAVERLTDGRSLDANIALVRDNARLDAAIAAALVHHRNCA